MKEGTWIIDTSASFEDIEWGGCSFGILFTCNLGWNAGRGFAQEKNLSEFRISLACYTEQDKQHVGF